MIHAIYIFLILFMSVWIQIFFGYFGLIVPVAALSIVYITIVYGWRAGILYSIAAGLVIGLLYGDFIGNVRVFQMMAISVVAVIWLYKGDVRPAILQIIPGAAASFIYTFPLVYECYYKLESGFYLVLKNIFILLFATAIGGLIFPVYVKILDSLNNQLKLSRYSKAKEKLLKGS